jgi:phenylalanyl-tRNA synthetase alpha chain
MNDKIKKLLESAKKEIGAATEVDFEELNNRYLGRKSDLSQILHSLGSLGLAERKEIGALANKARVEIENLLNDKKKEFAGKTSHIDVTAPGERFPLGHIHPINQVLEDVSSIFTAFGYEIVEGPEVEDDWHNFEALNMPQDHPARDMQDTFYLDDGKVLRTHTSPMQIRYLENHEVPIKIVSPGKVYRNEDEDASHCWSFHQMECLVIDQNITFSDLKGTLEAFGRAILGEKTKTRFRPSFFPYTEPSAELDASCPHCHGKGCRSCGYSGWVELLGSGMVHPKVLATMGIDPKKYSGFAFGLGLERIAMIKYEIPDVRYFWHPDTRFLEQF